MRGSSNFFLVFFFKYHICAKIRITQEIAESAQHNFATFDSTAINVIQSNSNNVLGDSARHMTPTTHIIPWGKPALEHGDWFGHHELMDIWTRKTRDLLCWKKNKCV